MMAEDALDLEAWDIPYRDIEEVYVVNGSDDVAYLIVEVRNSPPLMIYSDDDMDLVIRAMDALMEAAGIQGVQAVPREGCDVD